MSTNLNISNTNWDHMQKPYEDNDDNSSLFSENTSIAK